MYCIINNNLEFVNYVLGLGADPNLVCKNNNTPMHTAFKYENFDIVMTLIDAEGNLNMVNSEN